jgi:hypothetical protein
MKVTSRITSSGIIEERVFDAAAPATFNLEVPGYTQTGDPIGSGGGGGGGGGSSTAIDAFLNTGAVAQKVGVVYIKFAASSPTMGSAVTIHDVGNGSDPQVIEIVQNEGDPVINPGAYPIVYESPLASTLSALASVINNGDTLFSPKAWALKATAEPSFDRVKLEYTGLGGESGGEPAVDSSMDISFEVSSPSTVTIFLSHDNMSQTTIDARLSRIEPGDGCIIVPLSHVAGGVWSDVYPVHPNGITVTAISWYPSATWLSNSSFGSGVCTALSVRKDDNSGTHILTNVLEGIPALSGLGGFPIALRAGAPPLGFEIFGDPVYHNISLDLGVEDLPDRTLTGTQKIYVRVESNDGGTTAPADGESKLAIFYRVNPL